MGGVARARSGRLAVVRAHVLELVALPLALLAALVGGGVAATLVLAASQAAASQLALQAVADGAAASFTSVLLGALNPLLTVQSVLAGAPGLAAHSSAQAFFANAAPGLLAESAAIACVELAPYGHLAAIYPLVTAAFNLTTALGTIDLFNPSPPAGIPLYRPAAQLALTSRSMVLQGPQAVFSCVGLQCSDAISPTLAIIARLPIFVASNSSADTWADARWPGAAPGTTFGPFSNVTDCSSLVSAATGISLCSTNALGDGLRFWGFATILLSWQQLLYQSRVSSLDDGAGYLWSIARLPDVFPGGTNGSASINTATASRSSNGGALPTAAFSGGVESPVTVVSSCWVITLQLPTGTFVPSWQTPVLATEIVLSVLVAAFVCAHLIERRMRFDLLFSLLPERVVAAMGRDAVFSERFEHVTVLFSDICRFTDIVSAITPAETLALLDRLFKDFDAIAERTGVVKIETVGDSYMCVAGSNSMALSPEAQARQMAGVALELIEAARRHESPTGGEIRIRVGVHGGPVVAGVIGRTLPHWTVFGDAVNLASRMESTSLPGRCQVSSATARLLALSLGPADPFELQLRGQIAVKGKGVVTTHWLVKPGDRVTVDEIAVAERDASALSPRSAGSASLYVPQVIVAAPGPAALPPLEVSDVALRPRASSQEAAGGTPLSTRDGEGAWTGTPMAAAREYGESEMWSAVDDA